ncbi:MAG: hypothetical protein ACJ75P_04800 [Gaiellaceae bacterium]
MTPDFDELVEGVQSPEERARLRRVHQLLAEAGPPPELSPVLASVSPPDEEPTDEADVSWLPPRRLGAALVLAATLILASFAVGYFAGDNRSDEGSEAIKVTRTIVLHGEGQSTAVLSVGEEDADGNTPMLITVRGLAPLPAGDYYALALTKHGDPVVTCTTFNVGDRGTKTVDLVAAYDLKGFDGWAVTHWHASTGDDSKVLWTKRA